MNLNSFLSGIYMITFLSSGLFFLKYYKASGDRFFGLFSGACAMLAVERVVLLILSDPLARQPLEIGPRESWVFIFRLVAFMIILFAVIDKNKRQRS